MDNQETEQDQQNQKPQEEQLENEQTETTEEDKKPSWMPSLDKKPTADQEVSLSSKKNWYYVGLIIAILNPIFAGLIMGVFFLTEKELRKEGRIVLFLAIVFGFIHTYAVLKIIPYFIQQGLV